MERFWSKVEKAERNACWFWKGGLVKSKGGFSYGVFWYKGGPVRAHRVAWELTHGTRVPAGLVVTHSCDEPLCCNPKHLIAGTQRWNVIDRDQKGRQRTCRGTEHKLAKLTDDAVREIRKSELSRKELAHRYGVASSLIGRIIQRKSWAHVQ